MRLVLKSTPVFLRVALLFIGMILPAGNALAQSEHDVMKIAPPLQQGVAPVQPAQPYRARRRYDAPRPRFPTDAALGLVMPEISAAQSAISNTARTRIALVGDSMAEALAFGFEADAGLKAEFQLRQRTVSASGLVRSDYHDWPKAITALTSENPGMAALIVMVGLNDRQSIRIGDTSHEALSEGWREAYRKRVDTVIQTVQNARIPLIWVGLPIMRSPKLSMELAVINGLVRERVQASGETYIDISDGFSDETGGYSQTGPDVIGDIVRLRGPDGIHFTPAGQRKLAFFVEKPLRKFIGPGETVTPMIEAALPSLLPPRPRDEVSIPLPLPAAITMPKPRVEIGEIRSLSPANTASVLIDRRLAPLQDPATRDLFDRGLSPTPRPGRSDDFRWR
jgi:uncharacterized protein